MKVQEKIINWLKETLKLFEEPVLEYPISSKFGDYSTNIALVSGKGKNPKELAEEYKKLLEENKIDEIEKIEVAGPGFINLFLKKEVFGKIIGEVLDKKEKYGGNESLKDKKIIIEYTDPNPFKEFHIGHLMPNVIGESISRLIEKIGAEIKRANYQGDVGLQVAKAVWAIKNGASLKEAYAVGHKAYEENESIKNEIIEINKKIYDKSDDEINSIYEKGRKESLDGFEEIYKRLGTKFDYYFFESEVASYGREVVEKNIGDIFEESQRAVVFKGENFDSKLHTRVFINKEGLPTYEAKELGLSKIKYDKYPYDLSIVITGNEINEYFKVLLKAMSLVFPELAEKTKHISHGMLKLPEGKMSSRTGNVITAEFLIGDIKEKILEKIKDRDFSQEEKDNIAEIVAIGAIKYSILKQAIGGDIVFDFEKSISFEGDSGPYLQYSVVRAKSILKKANDLIKSSEKLPEDWQTTELERLMERFYGIVSRSGKEYSPHYLVTYLVSLAGEFNSFYSKHKVVDDADLSSGYKLALTESFVQIMSSGLKLLGIKVPERM